MSKSESKKPDKEIRIGGIKASIWSSEVEQNGRPLRTTRSASRSVSSPKTVTGRIPITIFPKISLVCG